MVSVVNKKILKYFPQIISGKKYICISIAEECFGLLHNHNYNRNCSETITIVLPQSHLPDLEGHLITAFEIYRKSGSLLLCVVMLECLSATIFLK